LWRRLILLASGLVLGSLVLGGLLLASTALPHATTQATAQAAAGKCAASTLNGTYVFAQDGYQIVGKDRIPFAAAGSETYDGHGTGVFSQSINGKSSRFAHYTIAVTVHSDCTATQTGTDQTGASVHFDFFLSPDGSKFTFVETDPGFVASGVATRGTNK
jgi:hypothetical protein